MDSTTSRKLHKGVAEGAFPSTTPELQTPHFPFLKLPRELRDFVYDLYFEGFYHSYPDLLLRIPAARDPGPKSIAPALITVSRDIYAESSLLLFSKATLRHRVARDPDDKVPCGYEPPRGWNGSQLMLRNALACMKTIWFDVGACGEHTLFRYSPYHVILSLSHLTVAIDLFASYNRKSAVMSSSSPGGVTKRKLIVDLYDIFYRYHYDESIRSVALVSWDSILRELEKALIAARAGGDSSVLDIEFVYVGQTQPARVTVWRREMSLTAAERFNKLCEHFGISWKAIHEVQSS